MDGPVLVNEEVMDRYKWLRFPLRQGEECVYSREKHRFNDGWFDYLPGKLVEGGIFGDICVDNRGELEGDCLLHLAYRRKVPPLSDGLVLEAMGELESFFDVEDVIFDPVGYGGIFVRGQRRAGSVVPRLWLLENGIVRPGCDDCCECYGMLDIDYLCRGEGNGEFVGELWERVSEAGWVRWRLDGCPPSYDEVVCRSS
jgi:hypothetical protein